MYWLISWYSKMKLSSKNLIYQAIFKLIWTNGIELWGGTKSSNRLIIQNKFLRIITNVFQYTLNEDLHKDLNIKPVNEVTRFYMT